MKNSMILMGIGVMIILVGGFVFVNAGSKGVTGNVINDEGNVIQGDMQRVVLSQDGFNYEDVEVKAGQPISLSADSSVRGCLRSVVFNFDGKKYSKYLKSESEVLELPALKKGSYTFSCTMGMGFGKLVVK